MSYGEVIHFWFNQLGPADWFRRDAGLDLRIRLKFGETLHEALRGELFSWREVPLGRLAEIIVLDQFSRNIFRGKKEAFVGDALALTLAQEAVLLKADQALPLAQRAFLYMPYMHSESLKIHEVAVGLFQQKGLEYNYEYELEHKKIIERFGRYPHRNAILGRVSTPEEIEFMKTHPGF